MPRIAAFAASLLVFVACVAEHDAASNPKAPREPVARLCRELVEAKPHQFAERMRAVLDVGQSAAATLAGELEGMPEATGVDAALATLGRLGGPEATRTLLRFLADRGPHASAAALALADCPADGVREQLQATVEDRLADPTTRTAAAASWIRLGAGNEVRTFVRGVMLAGTPHGQQLEPQLGLPRRPRWAYERYLLQQALLAVAGQDFGMDTDAPWDELLAAADRIDAWLKERP
jgi:hypothetical protein